MIAALRYAVLVLILFAGAARAAADVQAIETPGKGNLTMCPMSWGYRGCNLYHHIKLPEEISVGDRVKLHFGSNPKQYKFPVARIVRDGDSCTVYSQLTETQDVEKIEIPSCGDAPAAH